MSVSKVVIKALPITLDIIKEDNHWRISDQLHPQDTDAKTVSDTDSKDKREK